MNNIRIAIALVISTFVAVPIAFGDDDKSFERKGKLLSPSAIIATVCVANRQFVV